MYAGLPGPLLIDPWILLLPLLFMALGLATTLMLLVRGIRRLYSKGKDYNLGSRDEAT